jgi:hypothetical protein
MVLGMGANHMAKNRYILSPTKLADWFSCQVMVHSSVRI